MSRLVAILLLGSLALAAPAHADEAAPETGASGTVAPPDMSDQAIGGSIGLAGGGRTTTGGLRITGHYLYQLSENDWFDGTASFTFGSSEPACFRDRMNDLVCDHSLTDGVSGEVAANVRRFLGGRGEFWPFVRVGVGLGYVRFTGDDVGGLAIPLHAGGGFRVSVAPNIAVTVEAGLAAGIALFSRGLGVEPQLGGGVSAGAEFRL